MPQGISPIRPQGIRIVETTRFEQAAKKLLTDIEYRALHLVLADNPLCGTPASGFDGLMMLPHSGYTVYYAVDPSMQTVFLLLIERTGTNKPFPAPPEETKKVRSALRLLIQGAAILAVKKGAKWLWERFKEYLLL